MANITYTRTYQHDDWIDNEDIVQAGGPNGFNQQFHDIEAEFDAISTVVGSVNTAINSIQKLNLVISLPVTLTATSASPELSVEIYDSALLPVNVMKVYFAAIVPSTGAVVNVIPTFLYRAQAANKIAVTVTFYNPTAATATFTCRVLGYAS
jgi:hypothetical protein